MKELMLDSCSFFLLSSSGLILCTRVCVCVFARFLPCQKASSDRPSSDGELPHENGHSDCKDQGENLCGAFVGHRACARTS